MNWRSLAELSWEGRSYGMKDKEFPAFADLPSPRSGPFEMAVEGDAAVRDQLSAHGWIASDAVEATHDLAAFQAFISRSTGEFSVLKEVYVALDVGWFSDRSAMYLARGRPVVVQDNGLDGHLPLGEGLSRCATWTQAAAAVEAIRGDPERHRRAARRIAEKHLDTDVVLGRFLADLGLPPKGTVMTATITIGFPAPERFEVGAESLATLLDNTNEPYELIVTAPAMPDRYRREMDEVLDATDDHRGRGGPPAVARRLEEPDPRTRHRRVRRVRGERRPVSPGLARRAGRGV